MIKIYCFLGAGALVFCAYLYGVNIAHEKCKNMNLQNTFETIKQTQQKQRIIYDTVYKTGADDVRCILRDKYTIAE